MKNPILKSYILKRLDAIDQGLSDFANENKPEFLHRLRVDIKKIKAVYSFADKVYKEKYNASNLKTLFHDAGEIRQIQVSIELLRTKSTPPKGLIFKLKKNEQVLIHQFIKKYPRYIKTLKKFRTNVHFPERLPDKKDIRKFLLNERAKANQEIKIMSRTRLHRYRIRMKKIMYLFNLLPERMQRSLDIDHLSIDRLQAKMGKWHDLHSAIELIAQEQALKVNQPYLNKLKQEELKQFNAMFKFLSRKRIE